MSSSLSFLLISLLSLAAAPANGSCSGNAGCIISGLGGLDAGLYVTLIGNGFLGFLFCLQIRVVNCYFLSMRLKI